MTISPCPQPHPKVSALKKKRANVRGLLKVYVNRAPALTYKWWVLASVDGYWDYLLHNERWWWWKPQFHPRVPLMMRIAAVFVEFLQFDIITYSQWTSPSPDSYYSNQIYTLHTVLCRNCAVCHPYRHILAEPYLTLYLSCFHDRERDRLDKGSILKPPDSTLCRNT